jgi:hypothetical protein
MLRISLQRCAQHEKHFDKMTLWKRARAASEQSGELAEGVGFEPTVGFPTLDFESSALNRTQPPFLQSKRNAERVTSNVQHLMQLFRDWTLDVARLSSGKSPASRHTARSRGEILTLERRARPETQKMLQFLACHR